MGREKKAYNAWLEWELTQRAIAGDSKPLSVWDIEELCGVNHRNSERTERHAVQKLRRKPMLKSSDD